MCGLAEQIKLLDEHDFNKEKLIDVVAFIVNGSYFCISKIKSKSLSRKLSRFLHASSNTEKLKSFKDRLFQIYLDLALDGIIRILYRNVSLPPSMGEDPKAVGIEVARNEVVTLLDLKDDSIRSVVLYGLGGIGKTTLATDVVYFLRHELRAYKYCRIIIENNCSEFHVKKLQGQILKDLFSSSIQLRDSKEGEERLFELFREATSQPVFLFIDNVLCTDNILRESVLGKLLPKDLSCLPNRSRILITTRKLDDTDMIEEGGVKRCAYRVKSLSDAASEELLHRKASVSADIVFDKSLDIHGLVKICGGVPHVLNVAGTKLRNMRKKHGDVGAYQATIDFLNQTLVIGEGNLTTSVVDVVYNALGQDFQDAFLDIAAFFNKQGEQLVGYIVGEVALQAIKEAALVKITEEGKVIVDDIVEARGRKLSEDDRITDDSNLRRVLGSERKKLEKLKGIWPRPDHDSSGFQLEAEHLKLMRGLRVLHLSERSKLDGEGINTFKKLRLLRMNGDFRMEHSNLENLAVLEAYFRNCDETCLPDYFEHLSSLKMLSLTGSRLSCLPVSFGQLTRLEELNISNCKQLSTLPDGFGQLNSLTYLDMSGCSNLEMVSADFEQLSSVCSVDASYCPILDGKAMDKLVEMKRLQVLNIQESPMLVNRWREVENRHALIVQDRESRLHEHSLSRLFFHRESRFLFVYGGSQLSEGSPGPGQVAFVLSMCDLSWPSNKATLKLVKQKIKELASAGIQIVYVRVTPMLKQNMEDIHQSLVPLHLGTPAWIASDEKWNILAGYSIFKSLSGPDGPLQVSNLHTLIACATVSVKNYVNDIELTYPLPDDIERLKDLDGGLSRLFFPIMQMMENVGQVREDS
ncbi:TMV resistance protein N-like [Cryptomeria japonica]|uniref:TMV resistance protein N-like n=1 Tax=Cryptomeria japonica TaxID=3369 RepID=UPI0027D9F47E|nr:TMV resistance protein N-like [Cryptomeria japonica]